MEILHEQTDTKGAFVVREDDELLAEMTYSKAGTGMIIIDHTDVSEKLRGQSVGKKLVASAVDYARENKIKILPLCPFASSVFKKVPEFGDLLN